MDVPVNAVLSKILLVSIIYPLLMMRVDMGVVRKIVRTVMWFVAVAVAAYILGYVVSERMYVCGAVFVPCNIIVVHPTNG